MSSNADPWYNPRWDGTDATYRSLLEGDTHVYRTGATLFVYDPSAPSANHPWRAVHPGELVLR